MTQEALNLVRQIHPQFRKLTEQLNKLLGIEFGYMKVFKDGSYFKIMDNLECLEEWVKNVETTHIFCDRNVTTYFDGDYNFTIWPKEPTCKAMEVYKAYDVWNGITVSKMNKDYVELYWFTKQNVEDGWHKWFIRNKMLLIEFIKNFRTYEYISMLNELNSQHDLFKFIQKFDIEFPKSDYFEEETPFITSYINLMKKGNFIKEETPAKTNLTKRELELLAIIGQGYTLKIAARDLNISIKTAQYYLEQIKFKTGLHFKSEFIKFYQQSSH